MDGFEGGALGRDIDAVLKGRDFEAFMSTRVPYRTAERSLSFRKPYFGTFAAHSDSGVRARLPRIGGQARVTNCIGNRIRIDDCKNYFSKTKTIIVDSTNHGETCCGS